LGFSGPCITKNEFTQIGTEKLRGSQKRNAYKCLQNMLLLGIDLGSSSVKASVIDGESGKCLATAFSLPMK